MEISDVSCFIYIDDFKYEGRIQLQQNRRAYIYLIGNELTECKIGNLESTGDLKNDYKSVVFWDYAFSGDDKLILDEFSVKYDVVSIDEYFYKLDIKSEIEVVIKANNFIEEN